MAISPQRDKTKISPIADKEVLNVRHIPNHANHPNRRNLHGKMSRRQPELVNGFVPLATEMGERL
jgi:hypothetical protein